MFDKPWRELWVDPLPLHFHRTKKNKLQNHPISHPSNKAGGDHSKPTILFSPYFCVCKNGGSERGVILSVSEESVTNNVLPRVDRKGQILRFDPIRFFSLDL
ncbi:MAG: hypothetical protein ACYC59_08335 [Anaerolineaceae bacterium]